MRRREAEVVFTDTQWDHEVDVLCIGAEAGVLAAGVAAANAGADVYMGVTDRSDGGGDLAASLCYGGGDRLTTKHLAGFDYAFERSNRGAFWPVRAVEDIAPPPRSRSRGAIEPFFGAALEQWAHRCAAAPSGVLYEKVRNRQMTEVRSTPRGEKVEAAVIGPLPLSRDLPAVSVTTWLRSRATAVGLRPRTGVRLLKLIFEDGPVGALLDTPDGVIAVRANENLIIGVGDPVAERMQALVSSLDPVTAHVCLVSKPASRFGQLEIVTAAGEDSRLLFLEGPEPELELAASGL
jgi:hypothetical protein